MISRRGFLEALLATGVLAPRAFGSPAIDRNALVTRHNPRLTKIDPLGPLSLGNGEFAFTADITGLQTFPRLYSDSMPLCTMSQWGWHTRPLPSSLKSQTLRPRLYETYGRKVGYHTGSDGQTELFNWLRENPHRLHLGQIGLCLGKTEIDPNAISEINQELDLWRGVLNSKFKLFGEPVSVTTAVHPDRDLLAVVIESRVPDLAIRIAFPYGSSAMRAADWSQPDKHETRISADGKLIARRLDEDSYYVAVQEQLRLESRHTLLLTGSQFVVAFSQQQPNGALPTAAETIAASERHWERFWTRGAAVELAHSKDTRAFELERRVVLSQYLTAIQCSGSMPPQETGLTVNSWYGKFHLEMHWWHATHFALWNRLPLFERSLRWYQSILPRAVELAQSQGYRGARWPKMVGPEGRDSPSPIGPLLIWQQPHPIFYAEQCYQARTRRSTLQKYRELVFQSAEFMADYAYFDKRTSRYVLGPPVIPAQENHPPAETWNPTFELSYWSYGLKVAQRWRERLGLRRNAEWDRVIRNLSPLPVKNGVYLAHENCPETFSERNYDHPSMLAAFGVLPGDGVDKETMRRTLRETIARWQWDKTWGWDYPMTAMTAARLGETRIAVDALLMNTEKNRYLVNGHNWQRQNLPCYLPGNGGLLYAIAMMAGGWKGGPGAKAPGFPADGSWTVRSENMKLKSV
jgi:protein-glucosylgalactosylhydroxylysine glucosidase